MTEWEGYKEVKEATQEMTRLESELRSVRIVDIREGRGKRNNWPTFAEEWGQNGAREEELCILHSAP